MMFDDSPRPERTLNSQRGDKRRCQSDSITRLQGQSRDAPPYASRLEPTPNIYLNYVEASPPFRHSFCMSLIASLVGLG
jgi:hypothetical protein